MRGLALKRSCVELSTRFPDAYIPGNRSAASIQLAALLSNISDIEASMGTSTRPILVPVERSSFAGTPASRAESRMALPGSRSSSR